MSVSQSPAFSSVISSPRSKIACDTSQIKQTNKQTVGVLIDKNIDFRLQVFTHAASNYANLLEHTKGFT